MLALAVNLAVKEGTVVARRQPGEGSVHQRARDGMWVGTIEAGWTTEGKRRRKSVTSRTQAGALTKLRKVRAQYEATGTVTTGRGITLGEWLDRWLADLDLDPGTVRTYRHKAALIKEAAGKVRLDDLTPGHVRAVHQHAMSGGRNSTSARHCHRVLNTALKAAILEGVTTRNPAAAVKAPRQAPSTATALSAAQGMKLLRSVDGDPLATRWAMALLYGVRQGECLGLTLDSIDRERGLLDISWQLQRLDFTHGCGQPTDGAWPCGRKRGGNCPDRRLVTPTGFVLRRLQGGLCLIRPKSRTSRRVLPLTDWFAAMLDARAAAAAGQPNPHGLVFARPDGQPIAANADSLAWHAVLETAGLPSVRLHDARHTAASLLLKLGVDPKVIQDILGHSDVVTSQGYQHTDQAMKAHALEGVGRMLTAG